ncbi:MAG: aspartyl-trna synthetase [Rhodovulum sp.]|nr:aspartyl-trna synthetase [Rhodovulum sp.]
MRQGRLRPSPLGAADGLRRGAPTRARAAVPTPLRHPPGGPFRAAVRKAAWPLLKGAIAVLSTVVALNVAATIRPAAAGGAAAAELPTGSVSGLPVPRFVSLKPDRVNVRGGPTKDHEVTWVYTRAGLPVEITAEFENWRRIRDWEGAEGWVYHSLLSGKRTAFVARAKGSDDLVPVRADADPASPVKAQLEPGVVGTVKRCDGTWCRFVGDKFDGWIAQERLWGVYPNEKID